MPSLSQRARLLRLERQGDTRGRQDAKYEEIARRQEEGRRRVKELRIRQGEEYKLAA